ncbi:outer membrane beta-barrel protein [Palleronia pelagia]|uniref:Outer membrane protein beta-barrel domain-containing protein n=1 Tax=Palleronia pelagia TaxID=387096 RepID=A0A1H8KU64_9RHOB|nr:hypothetical protein SAMN04488011_108148 [Palleronia pelagia]
MKPCKICALACALAIAAPAAHAVEFHGGDVSLSFSRFEDDLIGPSSSTSFGKTAVQGSFQFDLTPDFGVQVDASYFEFNRVDQSEVSLGLHGIYYLDWATAVGVYYTHEELLSSNVDELGVEASRSFALFDVEANLGWAEYRGDHATVLGLQADYELQPQLFMGLGLDHADFDGATELTRVGVGIDYAVTDSLRLSGELGVTDATVMGSSADDIFIEIGASYAFGTSEGARFSRRGLLDRLPGL